MSTRYDSQDVDPAPLARPLKFEFSGRTAPNRFLKAAMTERVSSWSPTDISKRGVPSDDLINIYRRWGEGGFGMILTGNIMVDPDHLEAAGNPVVPLDAPFSGERFDAFAKLASEAKQHGSLIVGQVGHPGRQTPKQVQPHPLSASDVQLKDSITLTFGKPRPMTKDEIQLLIKQWTHTAVYLHKAGFDGIQMHSAHGYLLAQFLSQTTNKRTDEYGGPLENRARVVVEIARSIRKELPPSSGFILGIKVNSVEFQEGGFTTDEAKELCKILEQNEFDFVELSGGTYEEIAFLHKKESTKKRESFFLDFAEKITPVLSQTKSYITGGLRTVGAMVTALDTVDGVGLGRPATQEFNLPNSILAKEVKASIQQKIDPQNFLLTNIAAGSQIKQVGKDQQPIDLSDEKNVQLFLGSFDTWAKKMAEDAARSNLYGFVDLPEGEMFITRRATKI